MTKKIIILLILFGLIVPSISFAAAAGVERLREGADDTVLGDKLNMNLDNLDDLDNHQTTMEPPAVPKVSFPQFIGTIIKTILAVLGVIFIVLVIYAGSIWVFSMGDASKIGKAKSMLIAGVIGMIIIVGSYIIVSFLISAIAAAPTNSVPESTTLPAGEGSSPHQAGPDDQ